jgi:hypothetical protein
MSDWADEAALGIAEEVLPFDSDQHPGMVEWLAPLLREFAAPRERELVKKAHTTLGVRGETMDEFADRIREETP